MSIFHFGYDDIVLFHFWHIDSVVSLFISMVVVFTLAVLNETMKPLRMWAALKLRTREDLEASKPFEGDREHQSYGALDSVTVTEAMSDMDTEGDHNPKSPIRQFIRHRVQCIHLVQTVLHALQLFLWYILMLAFMVGNVWLCLALILGAGFGYFVFETGK